MKLRDQILKAAKADSIPAGSDGLWVVRKSRFEHPAPAIHDGKRKIMPAGTYTSLSCYTEETLMTGGECVMEDSPFELRTHLNFMLRASGRVLITGLGLGCVTRGTLANPAVTSVTVLERDASVMKLVAPHMPKDPRLKIIMAEALEWSRTNTETFDCAWHDLWTNKDLKEPHLVIWHQELLLRLRDRIPRQGAWDLPKWLKRVLTRTCEVGTIK